MAYIGNVLTSFNIGSSNLNDQAVTADKLSPSSVGSNGQVLAVDGSGNLVWANDAQNDTLTTQGDLLYRDGSGYQRLGAGTNGYYLKTQGSGANPVWAAVSQYSTPLTTRGDILFRDASGDQRLAAGTSGYFLKTQGSGADPVWSAVPAGITINNQADNRVVTATGTTNTLNGEASLTFDGTKATAPVHTASNGIVETAATIGSNHTITTNYNAMSVGPVAVSATLTIPSGSVWTIV